MVGLVIIGIIFVLLWIGIIYDIKNAPYMDDYGNIIEKKKKL